MKKRALPLLLCLVLVVVLLPAFATADGEMQKCGENLYWSFNEDTGMLIITGEGTMNDYLEWNQSWYRFRDDIIAVSLSDGVTSIGNHAFDNCKHLESIVIPDSVTTIGDDAFIRCKELTRVSISNNVTSIGEYAFAHCQALTSINLPETVVSIDKMAFYGCISLTSITIPRGIASIGDGAFNMCSALTSVTIPDGIPSIGIGMFEFCTSLQSVTLPDSITSIGNGAFNGCSALTSIVIPDGVTSIGDEAFKNCSALLSATIPNGITNIGYDTFCGCTGLTSVTIPVCVVTEGGFSGCTEIADVHVTKGMGTGELGSNGPWKVSEAKVIKVVLDEGITSISSNAFENCKGLASINIPESVTSIGEFAFYGCESLTSITIPSKVTNIGYSVFSDCTGLTSVIMADSVTSIGKFAFYGCESLTSVRIPDNVTSIGDYAFYGCERLMSIHMPSSVTSIGEYAFRFCDALEDVFFQGNEEQASRLYFGAYNDAIIGAKWHYAHVHIQSEPVYENVVPATHTSVGSYDNVIYCTICGDEISREKIEIEIIVNHIQGDPIRENEIEPTCITTGSYYEVIYCIVCGEELSREAVVVEATGHVPGEPVRENEVKATTTTRGHYDEVVYCTVCGEELSREEKVINKSVKGLTITGEPESAMVKNGEKAKFTVKISGKATAIQWYYRTSETAKWKKVSSKGNKVTLTVAAKPGNDGYQYRCELKNGTKKLYSDTVTLDVELFPPTISSQPESAAIQAGEEATFTFGVEGEGVTYAWSYRKSATGKWATVKGGTGATLTVTGTAANAGYQYKCEAKNKDGKVTSDIVTLDVEYHLPEIVTPPKGAKVKKNAKVTFNVEANDPYEGELTFQWYSRKNSKAKWTKVKGATEATYSFKATAKKSGYQYKCDITNHDGTVSTKAATLKVK